MPLSFKHPLNPWTYKQSHTPTMVQGGGGVIEPPLGFLLCYNILGFYSKLEIVKKQQKLKYLDAAHVEYDN